MSWLNLSILALMAAGHAEVLVTVVNRIHSLPIARPKLRQFRHADDLLILVFPFILLWFVGLRGPALLRGGRWSELSPFWMVYLALCVLGCVGLVWSIVRWTIRRVPAIQISNHSRTVDIAERLGYPPLGPGAFRWLARMPGNEIFRVQVSDKRYRLPNVCRELSGLSILHLTDTHFVGSVDRPYFEEIARLSAERRPDMIVFTGDLLDESALLSWLPETFGKLRAPLGCYYSLGNHDWFIGAPAVRDEFNRCGWTDVGSRVLSVANRGRTIQIGGTERPWMGVHPEFPREEGAFRLLLSHTPDHFAWARSQGIDLMLSGHNHGGQVVLPLIGPAFAPSRYGVRYIAGAYWSAPTLMYVSRGLSGRHPLRLNCPPELTTIVLESAADPGPIGT